MQIAMADAYDIIVSVEGDSGSGDTVINNDTDYVQMSPILIRGGVNVAGATYKWEKLTEGAWKAITHTAGGDGVTLIEWAELFKEELPEEYLQITLLHDGEGRRAVLQAQGERYEKLLREVEKDADFGN